MQLDRIIGFTLVGLATLPGAAMATNGYFLPGYGAKSVGMGGAAIAYGQDSVTPVANPANIFDSGTRFDIGLGLFNPPRRAYVDARGFNFGSQAGEARSKNDWFPIPNFGFTFQFSEKLAFGIAAHGNGLGSKYVPNYYDLTGASGNAIGVDLIQLLVPITVGYRVTDTQGLGVSVIPARQRFRAKGLASFSPASNDFEHLTDQGYDYSNGVGARLGWKGDFLSNKLSLGAMYTTKIYMSKFDKYRGLFAEQGDFDIPGNFGVGLALKPTEKLTVAFDWFRILYADVASIGNPGLALNDNDASVVGTTQAGGKVRALGKDDGLGFGWRDQNVYKLGVNYLVNDKLTVRAGLNYGRTPIPDSELAFNVIAPATVEKHAALGLTYDLGQQSIAGFGSSAELSLAYLHAFRNKQSGPSAVGENSGGVSKGYAEFEMKQNQFEISYGLKF